MKNDGVTLIEMLTVITIIAVMLGFAALSMVGMTRDAKITESRDQLLADIQDTKLKSIAEVPHAVYIVGGTGSSYTLQTLPSTDVNFKRDATDTPTSISTVSMPSNVKVGWNNTTELWFDRKGLPKNSNWQFGNGTFTIWYDANNNNVSDAGESGKTIVISRGGRIQYEQ